MTYKDFFKTVIRILGLYSMLQALFSGPQWLLPFAGSPFEATYLVLIVVPIVGPILIFIVVIYLSDLIIEKRWLMRGYDREIVEFGKLDNTSILGIGCVVIGGWMFLMGIPGVLHQGYNFLKAAVASNPDAVPLFDPVKARTYLVESIIRLFIGLLLMTNFDKVSRLLAPKANS